VAGRFEGVSGRLDGLDDRLQHLHARLDELDGNVTRVQGGVDALPGSLDIPALHRRFDEVHGRFEGLHGHVDESVRNNVELLTGSLERGIDKLQDALEGRPDRDELDRALRKAQLESERRITEQLDAVLAEFAEVVISQNAKQEVAAPRPAARKAPKKSASDSGD
jgi:hypothetical protein